MFDDQPIASMRSSSAHKNNGNYKNILVTIKCICQLTPLINTRWHMDGAKADVNLIAKVTVLR